MADNDTFDITAAKRENGEFVADDTLVVAVNGKVPGQVDGVWELNSGRAVPVDDVGEVDFNGTDVIGVSASDIDAIPSGEKGSADGVASLDGSGDLPGSQLPQLAITETYTVAAESDLTNQTQASQGDVCVVNASGSGSFILAEDDPTVRDNWTELEAREPPVSSVFGRTGDVTAEPGDYSHGQLNDVASDQHHTRPSAGAKLAEDGSNAFNVQPGQISPDELNNVDVTALLQGPIADRPSASNAPDGARYEDTDNDIIYRNDPTNGWVAIGGIGSASNPLPPSHHESINTDVATINDALDATDLDLGSPSSPTEYLSFGSGQQFLKMVAASTSVVADNTANDVIAVGEGNGATASVTVHGVTDDGTRWFIDKLLSSGTGTSVIGSEVRDSPPARSYSISGALEIAIDGGGETFDIVAQSSIGAPLIL